MLCAGYEAGMKDSCQVSNSLHFLASYSKNGYLVLV